MLIAQASSSLYFTRSFLINLCFNLNNIQISWFNLFYSSPSYSPTSPVVSDSDENLSSESSESSNDVYPYYDDDDKYR